MTTPKRKRSATKQPYPVSVRVPPSDLARLKQLAKQERRSMTQLLCMAIEEFLDRRYAPHDIRGD